MTDTTTTELLELASQLIADGEITVSEFDFELKPVPDYSKGALLALSNVYYSNNPDEWIDIFYQWRTELLPDFVSMNADGEHLNFASRVQHFANLNIEEIINGYIWDDVRKILAKEFSPDLPLSSWEIKEMIADQYDGARYTH